MTSFQIYSPVPICHYQATIYNKAKKNKSQAKQITQMLLTESPATRRVIRLKGGKNAKYHPHFWLSPSLTHQRGCAKTHLRHCEHPKGARQSPNLQNLMRLLRRFAPRNDTKRRLLAQAHQRERKFLKPQSAYFRAQKILTIDEIATSGGLLAMTDWVLKQFKIVIHGLTKRKNQVRLIFEIKLSPKGNIWAWGKLTNRGVAQLV